ncbi:alpha/beta fold hydrolase [Nocardia neocaledoniensis]|uniref:alpha/beta fold hydrolase n=1 Tax=Nocardia neocaledoniensis TaxID=236511 RepID=UPI00245859D6|nr:alpha/beta hydrolase [Nocardia neocaledoniensis]
MSRLRHGVRRVLAGEVGLEVIVGGTGPPLVLIQTGLLAEECAPLADALARDFTTIRYHRRGYAGSDPVTGPGSISRDARDCAALLTALDIDSAHVLGLSYSGAVALQLAADLPERVRSLILIEPPPVQLAEFRSACAELQREYAAAGADAALAHLMEIVSGPDWRAVLDRQLPGATAQATADAPTFFTTDLSALLTWTFTATDATRVQAPVLYLGGTASGPWFAEIEDLITTWFPHARSVLLPDADHGLALTHPTSLATAITTYTAELGELPAP